MAPRLVLRARKQKRANQFSQKGFLSEQQMASEFDRANCETDQPSLLASASAQ
jgi:hypothetical protein